ncbi:Hsp20/alpha crystallin family protein [uncultured Algimonas sp.]|uniref:Hsp20/alpha crystallin family protein n=1 Tax=uncultured Algimonas sp. TaxID=1547920 RepID=UPI00263A2F24|nr:Hsp20/alpha crystallin family protein [uncultured Algimonas sp.]
MANYPIIYRYRITPRARVSSPQQGYSIFDHMQREMADMFNRAQSLIDQDDDQEAGSFFTPAIDHHETDDEFRLSLELPGVKRDHVDVSVENGQIRISGEKKSRYERSEDGRSQTETRYGRFQRMLALPDGVDEDSIEATFEDGVLELTLPKTEETQPESRRIEIGGRHKSLPEQDGMASSDMNDNGKAA